MTVHDTLAERGTKYGNYLEQTTLIRNIIEGIHKTHGVTFLELEADQYDAILMIVTKISRILNGDPDYADNWEDIAGYATLVADRLKSNQ